MNSVHDTILIVDDDSADAEFTRRTIKEKAPHVQLIVTKNGEEALNLIFQKSEIPAADSPSLTQRNGSGHFWTPKHDTIDQGSLRIILLDLHMPGTDGFEVLRVLKSNHTTQHLPVIILSSSRELKDIEQCYALGANSYIVKPISAEQYEHTIEKVTEYWLNVNEQATSSMDIHAAHN